MGSVRIVTSWGTPVPPPQSKFPFLSSGADPTSVHPHVILVEGVAHTVSGCQFINWAAGGVMVKSTMKVIGSILTSYSTVYMT